MIKRVAVDSDGNVLVSGFSNGQVPCCERSFYTVKYAANNGGTLWEKWFVGPAGNDWPIGLAVDHGGNALVTGVSYNGLNPDHSSIQTIQYAAANGQVLWQQRYDSGTGGDDRPVGLALDQIGNVFLSGVTVDSCCAAVQPAYYLAKYAADGSLSWEQRRLTPIDGATSRDFVVPQSIVVDSHGNVIVNQRTVAGLDNLVQHAGGDGRVLWGQVFQVGNCIRADPAALAVDSNDNVIATGHACLPNNCGAAQLLTSKYAAADGHLQWQETFGAQAGSIGDPFSSFSRGVAVDNAGDIVVAGKLRTAGGNFDFVTLKYRPLGSALTTIRCPADIVANAASGQCSVVVNFSATATDTCDNAVPVTCSPPSGSVFPGGTTPVTCSTPDGTKCSFTVTVTPGPLGFIGFLEPIGGADANGGNFGDPLQTFKLKSTIPVKFKATCDGSPVLTGIHTLQAIKYSNQTTGDTPIDATPTEAATSGNQFRLTGDEWHFNLDTKATGMSTGIWLLRATLSDGRQHSVWIQIR
jgi:hypothetical protein